MREVMTKSMARNIFYGGSLFFIIIFLGLSAQSHLYIKSTSTNEATLTASVVQARRSGRKTPVSIATRSSARAPITRPSLAMS